MRGFSSGADDDDEEELECPLCAQQNAHIVAIRERQVEMAQQHDLFKGEMKRALEGERFGVVGDFFGRGVMMPDFAGVDS